MSLFNPMKNQYGVHKVKKIIDNSEQNSNGIFIINWAPDYHEKNLNFIHVTHVIAFVNC